MKNFLKKIAFLKKDSSYLFIDPSKSFSPFSLDLSYLVILGVLNGINLRIIDT